MQYSFKTTYEGQQKLRNVIKQAIPLISEHFANLDGKKVKLASGDSSAAMKKATKALRDSLDVENLTIWSDFYISTAWLNFKVFVRTEQQFAVAYFEHTLKLGDIENGVLKFDFNAERENRDNDLVLDTTPDQFSAISDRIRDLKKQLESAAEELPYPYRALVR